MYLVNPKIWFLNIGNIVLSWHIGNSQVFLYFYNFRQIVARFQQKETTLFVLRVMVGAIILYDHVHPVGAFYRKSNIDVSQLKELTTL